MRIPTPAARSTRRVPVDLTIARNRRDTAHEASIVTRQRATAASWVNGTKDPLVPFDGGEVDLLGLFYRNGKVRSSRQSGQYSADLDHIAGPPETSDTPVAVHGGGHGIPQPYRRERAGSDLGLFRATAETMILQ